MAKFERSRISSALMWIIIAAILVISATAVTSLIVNNSRGTKQITAAKIIINKDKDTGLCFAWYAGVPFAEIDCEKVRQSCIQKEKE